MCFYPNQDPKSLKKKKKKNPNFCFSFETKFNSGDHFLWSKKQIPFFSSIISNINFSRQHGECKMLSQKVCFLLFNFNADILWPMIKIVLSRLFKNQQGIEIRTEES